VNPKVRSRFPRRLACRDSKKIPEKIPKKFRSRSVALAFKRVRDLDVFPGFLCTKDARVSLGCKAYHAGCI
jgi:hypothetical protein